MKQIYLRDFLKALLAMMVYAYFEKIYKLILFFNNFIVYFIFIPNYYPLPHVSYKIFVMIKTYHIHVYYDHEFNNI